MRLCEGRDPNALAAKEVGETFSRLNHVCSFSVELAASVLDLHLPCSPTFCLCHCVAECAVALLVTQKSKAVTEFSLSTLFSVHSGSRAAFHLHNKTISSEESTTVSANHGDQHYNWTQQKHL